MEDNKSLAKDFVICHDYFTGDAILMKICRINAIKEVSDNSTKLFYGKDNLNVKENIKDVIEKINSGYTILDDFIKLHDFIKKESIILIKYNSISYITKYPSTINSTEIGCDSIYFRVKETINEVIEEINSNLENKGEF